MRWNEFIIKILMNKCLHQVMNRFFNRLSVYKIQDWYFTINDEGKLYIFSCILTALWLIELCAKQIQLCMFRKNCESSILLITSNWPRVSRLHQNPLSTLVCPAHAHRCNQLLMSFAEYICGNFCFKIYMRWSLKSLIMEDKTLVYFVKLV